MERSDISLAVGSLFQSLAQDGYVLREVRFFYRLMRPDVFEQLVLAHDARMILDQDKQSLEHLRSQGDRRTTAAKGSRLGIKDVTVEAKDHVCYSMVEIRL